MLGTNRKTWKNMQKNERTGKTKYAVMAKKPKQTKQILQHDKTKVSLKLRKASTHFIRRQDRSGECSPE